MAEISKITLPNGDTYDIKDAAARSGTVETSRLVRPTNLNGVLDATIVPQIDDLRANRLAFLPADQIIIEKTTDGGATWQDAGISDNVKLGLFSQTRYSISIPLLNGQKSILCGLRVTFTAMKYNVPSGTAETEKYSYWNSDYVNTTERYNQLREMYFFVSSNTDAIKVKAERATGKNPNNWIVLFDRNDYGMTGWSGNDYISFSQGVFGGGKNQTGNYWNYRLTFMTCGPNGSSTLSGTNPKSAQVISEIRGYGTTWWTAGNKFASSDHMYSWDNDQNVTFPAKVTAASGFSGSGASLTNLNANNISSGTVPVARLPVATSSANGVTKLYTGANSNAENTALTPASLYNMANRSICPYYSTSATYAVGDKVRNGDYIYECITAITKAEAWTAAHWQIAPTLQEQITALDGNVAAVQDGLAIVANGNTHASVAEGQFVYVRNHSTLAEGLYKASSAIQTNGELTMSNLTADGSGGLNDLQEQVTSLNSNSVHKKTVTLTLSKGSARGGTYVLFGIPNGSLILSGYVKRGSLGVNRNVQFVMYGESGYDVTIFDGGEVTTATSVDITIMYITP